MSRRPRHDPAADSRWAARLARELGADPGSVTLEAGEGPLVLDVAAGSRRARLVVEPPPGDAVPTLPLTPCTAGDGSDGSQLGSAESGAQNGPGHPRLPLVYATATAIRQANELGLGILENLVTALIAAGSISHQRSRGIALVHGPGWTATVRRCVSRLGTGRKAWTVTDVTARPSNRPADAGPEGETNNEKGRSK